MGDAVPCASLRLGRTTKGGLMERCRTGLNSRRRASRVHFSVVVKKKAPAGEEQRALLAREGLKSSQSPAGATMV
jgi:hypothetical protein